PLLVFLKDQTTSRLIDTIIQLCHKSLLRDLYKNHLKGNLVDLALHPIANFPIQRLTAASAKYKLVGDVLLMSMEPRSSLLGIILILFQFLQFLRLFDELVEGVESVLAAGHMGVIVQLAESCAESGEKQDEMMRCLLNVSLKRFILLKTQKGSLFSTAAVFS
ncbi:hypothetical protein XENOCAPTIV_015093, partial [Xenoophorus captivus]